MMFFDYKDGDFIHILSDSIAMDSDGHMMTRMGDSMALDMDSGELYIVSGWLDDEDNN
ncbi:MAG: hypothetical protein K2I96_16355 [Lachnospiraceae bacterium]|nr:hypothetical protein [Lachnospiraceae bacterium]